MAQSGGGSRSPYLNAARSTARHRPAAMGAGGAGAAPPVDLADGARLAAWRDARLGGCSALYVSILALHSEKGGDIARHWHWLGANATERSLGGGAAAGYAERRTQWRHEALAESARQLVPMARQLLRAAPSLAAAPCDTSRATPLHVAAMVGSPEHLTTPDDS